MSTTYLITEIILLDLHHPHTTQSLAAHWPSDPQFPLPGTSAIDYTQFSEPIAEKDEDMRDQRKTLASAFLEIGSEASRKHAVLDQFLDGVSKENMNDASQVTNLFTYHSLSFASSSAFIYQC